MKPQMYFRSDSSTVNELEVAKKYFDVVQCRTKLRSDSRPIVCRYSALPFNRELDMDLRSLGCYPINMVSDHNYIAEMSWMYDLEGLTFETFDRMQDIGDNFPVVVKGRTNSRKFEWSTKMFAKDLKSAIEISSDLANDPLIGPQGLVYRKYHELETFSIGLNGMPMTNEWRCFFLEDTLVSYGYYWSILDEQLIPPKESFVDSGGLEFAKKAAKIVSEFTNFYVVDVARDINGRWWVVELNDGQMSGLSEIDSDQFYRTLANLIGEKYV